MKAKYKMKEKGFTLEKTVAKMKENGCSINRMTLHSKLSKKVEFKLSEAKAFADAIGEDPRKLFFGEYYEGEEK